MIDIINTFTFVKRIDEISKTIYYSINIEKLLFCIEKFYEEGDTTSGIFKGR